MSKCKAKASQAHSGISRNYSSIFRQTLCNTGIFRTVVYPEPWGIQSEKHMQNPGIFTILPYSKSEAYSELCQTSTMRHFAKIVNGYDYFWKLKLLTQYKFVEISNFYWGIFQEFCLRLLLQNTSSYICSNST